MTPAICFYLHAHQPFRVKHYSVFEAGVDHEYFNDDRINRDTLNKVVDKSYLPTNRLLLELLNQHPEFNVNLSISGVLIEQMELWRPDALDSFKQLVKTGRVEILAETYYHSLSFFFSRPEFERQVDKHMAKIEQVFGIRPTAFRNTELSYNNDLALWADNKGFEAIITEGWDPILGWRSPNFVYEPAGTQNIKLLVKNYRLSDDIAFRFSERSWSEWPLTSEKYTTWLGDSLLKGPLINLFMDYETFGEHQWQETGIFDFLQHFPGEFLAKDPNRRFLKISDAVKTYQPADRLDIPHTLTWADTERDLTAWLGNAMQQQAIKEIYKLEEVVLNSGDEALIDDWRKLQISDHFYYMCTKWFNDGDVHAYFSPYESPYEAFMNYMNAVRDFNLRLMDRGSHG